MIRQASALASRRLLGEANVRELAGRALRVTSGRAFWQAAVAVGVVGGAAAGLHLPTSGATFVHIATGRIIEARGLGGHSTFMTGVGTPLDLRSWLLDLGLAHIYAAGGVGALELLAAGIGAAVGGLMLTAVRLSGRVHPVMVMVGLGLALAALDPAVTSLPALVLALLSACLLVCLAARRDGRSWAPLALVVLTVVWANADSSAVVAVPIVLLVLLLEHSKDGVPRPSWRLLLTVLVASCINPRGPLIYSWLPYSLGMSGEHPLLAVWGSPDFHPWGARLSELAALALLLGFLVAGSRRRRPEAALALVTAVIALIWTFYLPLFLVVAGVESASLLSEWAVGFGAGRSSAAPTGIPGRRLLAVAALPVLLSLALLARAGVQAEAGGGPRGQLAARLPVAAADWLGAHRVSGTWYTTPDFGDYLAGYFPAGGHLVCTSDPVADGARRLAACERLAVLNQGALAVLGGLRARLAVLPRAAPEVAFLTAEGWRIRYRDQVTVVLGAPPSNT